MDIHDMIRQFFNKRISAIALSLLTIAGLTITGCMQPLHKSRTAPTPRTSTESPAIAKDISTQPTPGENGQNTPNAPKSSPLFEENTIKSPLLVQNQDENSPGPLTSKAPEATDIQATLTDKAGTDATKTSAQMDDKKPQAIFDEALDYCNLSQGLWKKGELNAALEALDQAYALILGLQDIDQHAKLIQQKDDLRFLISKRILEIYASRHIVVNGDYTAIPMEVNPYIQKEIDRFTKGGEMSFFKSSYRRSGLYRPYIVQELKKAGLPEALSWLPLIESGFKVRALSKARALGLWQFIPSTGYKFGLSRNTYVDERLDPVKSTQAAIAYLKELHQIFGDWTTVLAAYNCGEGRVLRVIRSQKINYLDNFWDLYTKLPRETARYVPRFLATLNILENPEKYGLDLSAIDSPMEFETVTISKRIHLEQAAKAIGVSSNSLIGLNPELRYKTTPVESYSLRVPIGRGQALSAAIASIPSYRPPQPKYVYHRVRQGETVSTIARRYRTSVKKIAAVNRLNRRYTIHVGKKLKIPSRGTAVPIVRSSSKTKKRTIASRHKVRKGDSLWNIARRYGTTVNRIKRLNGMKTTALSIGQVLKIAGRAKSPATNKKDLRRYRVKSGDSPYQIATRNQMTLASFLRINQLTPRSKIYPGQRVYVE